MKTDVSDLSPSITNMIRMDHSHVLALFRRFKPDASLQKKQALVTNACRALEVHAQLEEEIFYPALRTAAGSDDTLDKSVPEHDRMRQLIGALRTMEPASREYEVTFRELIRNVLHHVADEETTLLPRAEEVLRDQLNSLGAQMTKRRMQLIGPYAGEIAASTARSFPAATSMLAAAGALTLGMLLFNRNSGTRRPHGRGFLTGRPH